MEHDIAYTNMLLKTGIEKGDFPKKLYKFRKIDKRLEEVLKNKEFYFSSPENFNDPFDCNLSFQNKYSKSEIQQAKVLFTERNPNVRIKHLKKHMPKKSNEFYSFQSKIQKKFVKECGIFSLSKSSNNITMWSHYSDSHKGLAFELDITQDYDFFNLFGIVEYIDEYELLSYAKDIRDESLELFLSKYIDWKYEKEIRIIDLEKNGLRKFKKKMISSILFGCKISEEDIKKVTKWCQEYDMSHVVFKKAKIIPGKFELDFDEIDKAKFL